ncbi:MAG: response regulator [Bacteroidales bacterium]|nr:response regulator [Bacteroidales bacterium]RLD39402.1 MAG: response regulator [Bacteroidota bacterium]
MGASITHQDWSDKTVLIAEDVNDNFLFLKTYLRKTKINVLWAKDGQEAIDMCLKNQDIDIVLMDIRMPNVDGYEATAEIKKAFPKMPVIAQTAYALNSDYQKVFDSGCDDYITKPILGASLLDKMAVFL